MVHARAAGCAVVALAFGCAAGNGHDPRTTRPGNRVIMISIDGLMPEVYLEPDALGLQVPVLRALAKRGAYARKVESVFPAVTYPAHTTMVTGVPPSIHRIATNRAPDPLDRNKEGWRWYSEDIAVPTLWQAVEAHHRRAALVTWPVTVAAAVTFLIPEYWRAGTADDQKLVRGLSTPGLLDNVARADPTLWKSFVPPDVKDAAQFSIARYLVANERFDLMLVHAWELDDAQHAHGPHSVEANRAIENADRLLGELLAAIERTAERDRTYVVVVSDHGFAGYDHQIRPNVVFAERGLVALDATGKPTAAKVAVSANGGVAYAYVLDPTARDEVAAALATLPDVVAILPKQGIAELGGDRDADFALVAAPGYVFSEQRDPPVVVDTPGKGHHGWPPSQPAMAASFIAIGPGVAARDLGVVRMVDIAPTLARWLDVPLPSAVGVPIELGPRR